MPKDNSDYKKSFIKPTAKGNETILTELAKKATNATEGTLKQSSKKKNAK